MSNQNTGQALRKEVANVKDFSLDKKSKKVAPQAFAQVVRALLQNWRQGTVACLTRSQVTGSTRKPWRQKGTGRARVGDVKSPLWRGGGIIFGPQKRVRTLKTSRKLRRVVACDLLQHVIENNRLLFADWNLVDQNPSTKQAASLLKTLSLNGIQTNVFVAPEDLHIAASFMNIPTVRVVLLDAPNVYMLADAQYWVVLKKDSDAFKSMVAQWT